MHHPEIRCNDTPYSTLRKNPEIHADLMEAYIGGVFEDYRKRHPDATNGQAFDCVEAWLRPLIQPVPKRVLFQLDEIGRIDPLIWS